MRCQHRGWTAVSVALLVLCASFQVHHSEAKARFLKEAEEGFEGHDDHEHSPVTVAPPSSGPCTPSTLLNGCMVQAPAGVEVHYELVGSTDVQFALKAQTTGYVAIGFTNAGQASMSPADAVIGWVSGSGKGTVNAYRLAGYNSPTPDSTVQLSNVSAVEAGGYTTVYFTRALSAGRYPIDLTNANFNVAVGSSDALQQHVAQGTFAGNLQAGGSSSNSSTATPSTPTTSSSATSSSSSATGGCVTSTQLVGGCMVDGGAGVTIHYKLNGSPANSITISLQARTSGYVAISFTNGAERMSPADGVIGWMGSSGASVQAYQINGYDSSDIKPDSTVPLTDTSASESGGVTTVTFTRPLNAGRYPISTDKMTFNTAQAGSDSLVQHSQATSGVINLSGGTVELSNAAKDKFWITHGLLMVAAWAFFVPHAVGFAKYKGKWSALLKRDAMWFHLHRLLQLIAAVCHIASLVVALTQFGDYVEDAPLEVHAALAWIITGLLGVQWLVALFLRPDKKAPRRPLWNLAHFSAGRIMTVLALANIGVGIYLYERKSGTLLLSTGAWVGIAVAALATALIHFLIMALRKAPPEKTDVAAIPVTSKITNPEYISGQPTGSNGSNANNHS